MMIYSDDPTYGASIALIERVTEAPHSTARRWKLNPSTMPASAAKLVKFAVFGDLAEIFGDVWRGFELRDGKLYPPFFRGGFTPLQMAGVFFELQELRGLRRDNEKLRTELEAVRLEQSRQWASKQLRALVE